MQKNKRRYNYQLFKVALSYKVNDLADKLSVTQGTVLNWHKNDGLQTIDHKRPYMFHGSEIRRFIKYHNQKQKMFTCELDELPCFKCRAPRKALNNAMSLYKNSEKSALVCAPCSICQTICQKAFSMKNLSNLKQFVSVRQIDTEGLYNPDDYGLLSHFSIHGIRKRKMAIKNHNHHGQFNLFNEVKKGQ